MESCQTLRLLAKRAVKKKLKGTSCQPRSQYFSIPFYFIQSFCVYYFTEPRHDVSSQGVFTKDVYHGTIMIYFTTRKQYRVLLELHITQRQLESPEKQNAVQLTCARLLHYHTYAMPAYFCNISYLNNFPLKPFSFARH